MCFKDWCQTLQMISISISLNYKKNLYCSDFFYLNSNKNY
jgi:hypothetical protein